MEKQLSNTIKTMLHSDRNHPTRTNTRNIIMLGRELLKTKQVVNSNGRREWTKFVREVLGESNQTYCQKAMYLAKYVIPPDHIKTKTATELYKLCTTGFYPMYKHIQKEMDEKVSLSEKVELKQTVVVESPFEHTYVDNRPNKDIVENFVVNLGKQYFQDKVNCLTLTCDRYQMHIDRLFDSFAKKVYVLERETDKMNFIIQQAQTCPYNLSKKVRFIPLDASDFTLTDCQFMDLDVGGSIATNLNAIKNHAFQQHRRDRRINIFAFSFSPRGGRHENAETNFKNLKSILNCLDIELIGFDNVKGGTGKGVDMPGSVRENTVKNDSNKYCKKHTVNYRAQYDSTTVYDLVYFTYDDGFGPMCHIAIAYKY